MNNKLFVSLQCYYVHLKPLRRNPCMAKNCVAHHMNPLGLGEEFLFDISHRLSNPWKVTAAFRPNNSPDAAGRGCRAARWFRDGNP